MSAKKNVASLFLIGILSMLVGCGRALTVDDVIERNAKAMGGRSAIEAVHSLEVNLHIVDPGFEVDGIYRAARPGRMRIDVQHQGRRVFTEAFDGEKGWQAHDQGEPEATSPKATAALRHGVQLPGKLFGLHEFKLRGGRIELSGREKIDGIDYYVPRLTFGDGYTTSLYVDPQSWLITRRRDVRPLRQMGDGALTLRGAGSLLNIFARSCAVLFLGHNVDFSGDDDGRASGRPSSRSANDSLRFVAGQPCGLAATTREGKPRAVVPF